MPTTHHFKCETCEGKPEFDTVGLFLYHLQETHQVVAAPGQRGPQGVKSTIMCLDGSGFSDNTYRWTFGDGRVSVVENVHWKKGKG